MGTIAAAGGFTLFLIPHKAHNNSGDNRNKQKAYNYGSNICFNHNNIQKTPFKEWVFFKLLLLK